MAGRSRFTGRRNLILGLFVSGSPWIFYKYSRTSAHMQFLLADTSSTNTAFLTSLFMVPRLFGYGRFYIYTTCVGQKAVCLLNYKKIYQFVSVGQCFKGIFRVRVCEIHWTKSKKVRKRERSTSSNVKPDDSHLFL